MSFKQWLEDVGDNPDNVPQDVIKYLDEQASVRSGISGKDWSYEFIPLQSVSPLFSVGSVWVNTSNAKIPRKRINIGAIRIRFNKEVRIIFMSTNLTPTTIKGESPIEEPAREYIDKIKKGIIIPFEIWQIS